MSYQVLARKWRPRSFDDVAGQGHVLRVLVNALDNDRLHHAYLFTGTRGVGKTTLARIFAKALNCERGVSSRPCGECATCREIDEGRFIDLLEVDAASRTKVEDTRELLDNVQYVPAKGRFKIYLIDEVHMLSKSSFNALLKTLEEPPPYVKFLLATTDPQKLPVTVLSRCLQFNLRRLPAGMIRDYLQRLVEAEGIAAEDGALHAIARAADGSMRDALSLLDQAIAFGAGGVRSDEVHEMLGTIDERSLADLLTALAAGDGAALMQAIDEVAMRTHDFADDFAALLESLLTLLHRIALAQVVPETLEALDLERELVARMADQLSPEAVQLYYQIGLIGRRDLPLAPDPRLGLEMVLLRMLAFRPVTDDDGEGQSLPGGPGTVRPREKDDTSGTAPHPTIPKPRNGSAGDDGQPAPMRASVDEPPSAATCEEGDAVVGDWSAILGQIELGGMARMFAAHCSLVALDEQVIELRLDESHIHLRSPAIEKRLETALQQHFGKPLQLRLSAGKPVAETPAASQDRAQANRRRAAIDAINNDPTVRRLQETFSAQILPETIEPTDED